MGKLLIYRILDKNGFTVYVGKSTRGLDVATRHFQKSVLKRLNTPLCKWIKSCLKSKFKPLVETIEIVSCVEKLGERERFWISFYKESGCILLNVQSGGVNSGGYKLSIEHRKKISKSLIGNKRYVGTPENRLKMSLLKKEFYMNKNSEVSCG